MDRARARCVRARAAWTRRTLEYRRALRDRIAIFIARAPDARGFALVLERAGGLTGTGGSESTLVMPSRMGGAGTHRPRIYHDGGNREFRRRRLGGGTQDSRVATREAKRQEGQDELSRDGSATSR